MKKFFLKKETGVDRVKKLLIFIIMFAAICNFFYENPNYKKRILREKADNLGYVTVINKNDFSNFIKGEYDFEISYQGAMPGDRIVLYTDSIAESNNVQGRYLSEIQLYNSYGTVEKKINIDQNINNLTVYVQRDSRQIFDVVKSITAKYNGKLNNDNIFLLIIAIALCIYIKIGASLKSSVTLSLIMAFLVSVPLYTDRIYNAHDMLFHMARINGVAESIKNGHFPSFINAIQCNGQGDISATMYSSFFVYIAAFLKNFGLSTIISCKTFLFLINFFTSFIALKSFEIIFKNRKIAICGSLLWTFSYYRIMCMYTRMALGEVLAMTFFPLVLAGYYEILWGERKNWIYLLLALTGVMLSHVISCILIGVFLIFEFARWLLSGKKQNALKRFFTLVYCAVLTVLANLHFLIPFLRYSMENFHAFSLEKNKIIYTAVYIPQIFRDFINSQGVAYSIYRTENYMPVSLGFTTLLLVFFFLYTLAKKDKMSKTDYLGSTAFLYFFISVIFASAIFPYNLLDNYYILKKLVGTTQFSWRFLGVSSVFAITVICCGCMNVFESDKGDEDKFSGSKKLSLVILTALICIYFLSPLYYFSDIVQNGKFRTLENEPISYMDIELADRNDEMYRYNNVNYNKKYINIIETQGENEVSFENYKRKTPKLSVDMKMIRYKSRGKLVFPLIYYPGYQIIINNNQVQPEMTDGMLSCDMPDEDAHIEIDFKGFDYFKYGYIISAVTVLFIAGGYFIRKKIGKSKEDKIEQ